LKIVNTVFVVIIAAVGIYAFFILVSDLNLVYDKIVNFKIEYLPIILGLVSFSWLILFYRWYILLKNSNINVPPKKSFLIFLSGTSLSITPGHIGEIIKSQLLKNLYNVPRTKTAPIIFIEKFYDLIGAIVASMIGIWFFEINSLLIFAAFGFLVASFVIISIESFFKKIINQICKINFFKKYENVFLESYTILQNSAQGRTGIISIILSILFWFVIGIGVYFVLLGLDIDEINFLNAISIYSLSVIAGALSFIPGGVGIIEGSLGGLLSVQGIELSVAIAVGVIIRFFTLWYTVIVGFFALKLTGGFSLRESDSKDSDDNKNE